MIPYRAPTPTSRPEHHRGIAGGAAEPVRRLSVDPTPGQVVSAFQLPVFAARPGRLELPACRFEA